MVRRPPTTVEWPDPVKASASLESAITQSCRKLLADLPIGDAPTAADLDRVRRQIADAGTFREVADTIAAAKEEAK